MGSGDTGRRRRGWRFRLGLFAATLVVAALGAEALVRVRSYLRHGPVDDIYDLYQWHPEVRIRVPIPGTDALMGESRIRIESHGFRSPELELPKPAGTIRLAFLGGSTTFCAEVSSNETTWPHLVAQGLAAAHPEARFDYLNAGVTGARVEASLLSLEHRVAPMDPDVIVIYHATNDLAVDSLALAVEAGLAEETPEPGWLERHSLLWFLVVKNLRWSRTQAQGRDQSGKLEYDAQALARGFRERLGELVRAAQEVADVVVLVTFSTKVRADQPLDVQIANLQQSFQWMPYLSPEGTLRGYAAYNAAIANVAAQSGALLVDGADEVPGDGEHFADSVHFTDRGCEAMAQRILARLGNAPALLELIAERSGR